MKNEISTLILDFWINYSVSQLNRLHQRLIILSNLQLMCYIELRNAIIQTE